MLSSSNRRRCSVSVYWIGTLVKREISSKLMTMSSDITSRMCIVCRKATDFSTSYKDTKFFHTSCRRTCITEDLRVAKQISQWRQTVQLIRIMLLLPTNILLLIGNFCATVHLFIFIHRMTTCRTVARKTVSFIFIQNSLNKSFLDKIE